MAAVCQLARAFWKLIKKLYIQHDTFVFVHPKILKIKRQILNHPCNFKSLSI